MTDIYDIKENLLGFPVDITITIIFLVFLIIITRLINFLNTRKKVEKVELKIENKLKIDYAKKLNILEDKYLDKNNDFFYGQVSIIIRGILEDKKFFNISKMTLKEINSLGLKSEIKDIIKNIYFKEYMKKVEDNKEIRTNIINKIRKLI